MIPDDDDSGDSLILQRRQQPAMILDPLPPAMILDPLPPAMIPDDRNVGEENPKVPKKRSETWVQEETRTLISLRWEIDSKHLWDQISAKMRNLLKEFKKSKQRPSSDPKSSSPALQFSDNGVNADKLSIVGLSSIIHWCFSSSLCVR